MLTREPSPTEKGTERLCYILLRNQMKAENRRKIKNGPVLSKLNI